MYLQSKNEKTNDDFKLKKIEMYQELVQIKPVNPDGTTKKML